MAGSASYDSNTNVFRSFDGARNYENITDANSSTYNQNSLYGTHPTKLNIYDGKPVVANPALTNYKRLTYASRIDLQDTYDFRTQLIRGTMAFSKEKLRELDPSYTGYTHIFVLRLPPFMVNVADGWMIDGFDRVNSLSDAQLYSAGYKSIQSEAANACNALKVLMEMGSTSYNGTPELTLNMTEVNTGFSERSYPAPTYAAYDGKNFTNRAALEKQKAEGVTRKLVHFKMVDRGIPREHYDLVDAEGNIIGCVTSGTMSPTLKIGIGMGYVKPAFAKLDTEIFIDVRGRKLKAIVAKPPFRSVE